MNTPVSATSWKLETIVNLAQVPGTQSKIIDICAYGMTARPDTHGNHHGEKTTRMLTNTDYIAQSLSIRCNGQHQHAHLLQ